MVPAVEGKTMNDVSEQTNESSERELPEEGGWSERLGNAVSDYEVFGAEDAAGLGL